ncbi:MAG: DEAD/DEAH box helicase [Candidatus Aenigmarchaeota archaeon]|nr:DEAD/DEAH box helicase [Candidatus Aenigmarchaeota archaeon]
MVFELLDKRIQNLIEKSGFSSPTNAQKLAIPKILEGKNVLVIAPTGSGKTEAAILPILHKIITEEHEPISAIYITPLRALNRDMLRRLLKWCRELEIDVSVRHGDTTTYERKKQSIYPPQLLITTPETVQAILPGKKLRKALRNVRFVIIDEVHELADSKRGTQLSVALQRLRSLTQKDFQIIMLSATVSQPEKVAKLFTKRAEVIDAYEEKSLELKVISPEQSKNIEQIPDFLDPEVYARLVKIKEIIDESRSCLIFTNTREFAELLSHRLKELFPELSIEVHHSSLSKEVRTKVEKGFKEGKIKCIVCTSSLQLGIDIGSVDHVIQYHSPREVIQFLQRVGRSGHKIEKVSKGYIIASDEMDILESMVIARKALHKEIEVIKPFERCYDILLHQTIGFSLDYGRIEKKFVFDWIKKSWPYRKLTEKEFSSLLQFMTLNNLVFTDNGIKARRRAYKYYFENLSVIPDVKHYKVINMIDRSYVGQLDEEFVTLELELGKHFLMKGEIWKVVSIEKDTVFVEPAKSSEAVAPVWEGELIPVMKEVSMEVRELIHTLSRMKDDEMINYLLKNYPIDLHIANKIARFVKRQRKYFDWKKFVVEINQNFYIFHLPFGSTINEAISNAFQAFLGTRIPKIFVKSNPYQIIIKLPEKNDSLIKEMIETIDENNIEQYIRLSIYNTKLFEWKFTQVAKRFGIISKNAELTKTQLRRLIEEFKYSFIGDEVLNEIFTEKIDINGAVKAWKIVKRNIELKEFKELSPLANFGIRRLAYQDFVAKFLEPQIFEKFKTRLLNTKLHFACFNCGQWSTSYRIKNLPEEIKCPICGSKLVAVAKSERDLEDVKRIIGKKVRNLLLTKSEKRRLERIERTAHIILNYGKKGAMVLAGKGIGPSTALKILNKMYHDDNEFLKEIFNKEKEFIKIRRFIE